MPLSLEARKTPRAAPPHPAQARLRVVGSPYPALGGPGPARLMIYVETQAHAAEPPSTPRMRASTTRELTGQAGQRAPARPLTGIANHQPSRPGRTIEPEKFPRPLYNAVFPGADAIVVTPEEQEAADDRAQERAAHRGSND